jgi:hypothetical protein
MVDYKDIVMPGRSHKAIGNTLRELKAQFGPGSDAANGVVKENASDSPKKASPKKAGGKATSKKRSAAEVKDVGSDDDLKDAEEVNSGKEVKMPKKAKKAAKEDAVDEV